jgi:diaminopimelate epimerase
MCDRHFGIGADQLLLVTESDAADIGMRLFNTDGFEAEMCGNACAASENTPSSEGSSPSRSSAWKRWAVSNTAIEVGRRHVSGATVAMGVPHVSKREVCVDVCSDGAEKVLLALTVVDMGNPHAVAFLASDVDSFALERFGPLVERHPIFSERTNFEVVNIMSPEELRLRVWERSAGITLACGTGACASVVAARQRGLVANDVRVHLPGGDLLIQWDGEGEIYMSGPAATVFEGTWCAS